MTSIYDKLRSQKRSSPEVIDVDDERAGADGLPAQKHARGAVDEGAEQSNKFTGDEVLSRVPTTAQGGAVRSALPQLHPVSFYGAGQQAVASAARQVASWVGNVTWKAPKAQPARHNVAGSSRLVPLEIGSDDDDEPAQGLAAPAQRADTRWLTAPRPPPTRDVWPVVVESDRAWIGLCQVQNCRLEFMNDRVSLRARRYDGVDIHYPDLPNDGIVTKLRSAYNTKDESQWPPDFCAVLVLETCGWPSEDCKDFFDPHSSNPQCRALCCLFLDNVEWTEKQRLIVLSNSWAKRWAKLSIEAQDELMVGRRSRPAAGALQAPLVYPPNDADSVTVTNADLRRLEVSEFLNDSLVDFALKRLQFQLTHELMPAEYERKFHFFNCFFFKKLLTEPSMRLPGYADEAHARVRKWTTHVDLFSKDFIVVPVNQSLHWSLVIMCHLGEAERLLVERHVTDVDADVIDVDGETAVVKGPTPVILHLNSMSGTHANVEDVAREYLAREWAARRRQPLARGEALFGKTGPVAFCRASVPQQENFYDCGIFLIEFARRFCTNTPKPYLSMRAADGWPFMLRPTWFQPSDAGESNRDALRAEILSLGECVKSEKATAGAGPATARAAAPVVSLADSDDEDAPIAGLLLRPEPVVAAAAARADSSPLMVSDDEEREASVLVD